MKRCNRKIKKEHFCSWTFHTIFVHTYLHTDANIFYLTVFSLLFNKHHKWLLSFIKSIINIFSSKIWKCKNSFSAVNDVKCTPIRPFTHIFAVNEWLLSSFTRHLLRRVLNALNDVLWVTFYWWTLVLQIHFR